MAEAIVSLDLRLLAREAKKLDVTLEQMGRIGLQAQARAIREYGEDWLSDAIMRAPVLTGALRASGEVDGPDDEGDGSRVRVGFGMPYAAVQDAKETVIRPVRAKFLFVPLTEGATPGDPSLVFGEDFLLLKSVTIRGNQYLTGQIAERQENMAPAVGRRMFDIMRGSRPAS